MRNYEITVIFNPTLEEEKRKGHIDRLNAIIESDGKVVEVEEWGLRKLAYLIDDLPEGYYYHVKAEGTPEMVKEYDRVVKILDGVMRCMIVRIDD